MIDFDVDIDTLVTELKRAEVSLSDKIFALQCAANELQNIRRKSENIRKKIDDDKKAGYTVYDPSDPAIALAKKIIAEVNQ